MKALIAAANIKTAQTGAIQVKPGAARAVNTNRGGGYGDETLE
ncbi:MAG: hypothetical protein ABIT83_01430 [Massilia sp.]